ncbi:sensor domain-containing diguanylate cyclase [Marinomonas epiphytica]
MDKSQEESLDLKDVLNCTSMAIAWSSTHSQNLEYINPAFEKLLGYSLSDVKNTRAWLNLVLPSPEYFERTFLPWREAQEQRQKKGLAPEELELPFRCKDKSICYVRLKFIVLKNKRLIHLIDITEPFIMAQRLKFRSELLDEVVKGSQLELMLHKLTQQLQTELPDALYSILLFNKVNQTLELGAAPNLPDFYNQAIHGVAIGPNVGSCGAAAYFAKRVVVEDIHSHPNWQAYKELANKANLRSCWSEPILASNGEVLGTFAIYHSYVTQPQPKDIELIRFVSNLASIAIENSRIRDELTQRAYFDFLTGLNNRRNFFELAEKQMKQASLLEKPFTLLMMDLDHFKLVNDTYGHKVGDRVLKEIARESESFLNHGVIGRIGGEEFAIAWSGVPRDQAIEQAERLREYLASLIISISDDVEINVTTSLGIVHVKKVTDLSIDLYMGEADKALYQAKKAGRNCTQWIDY